LEVTIIDHWWGDLGTVLVENLKLLRDLKGWVLFLSMMESMNHSEQLDGENLLDILNHLRDSERVSERGRETEIEIERERKGRGNEDAT
jgi:hypothetical protein